MGDLCDMNDVNRVMRSPEGMARLEEIRAALVGRTVVDVTFSNETRAVVGTVHLDDGETFELDRESLDVDELREEFADVIRREYLIDYPDRRTEDDEP